MSVHSDDAGRTRFRWAEVRTSSDADGTRQVEVRHVDRLATDAEQARLDQVAAEDAAERAALARDLEWSGDGWATTPPTYASADADEDGNS